MQTHSLPYLTNISKINLLQPLLEQPWSMLLDSAGKFSSYNQYDIFCMEPSVKLSFNGITCCISYASFVDQTILESLAELDANNPLECMRQIQAAFAPASPLEFDALAFNGGWMGYVSYDFARHLEKLPDLASDDIELPQIQMGLYQFALISDHQRQTTTLYNFGLNEIQWCAKINQFDSHLKNQAIEQPGNFKLTSIWHSNTSKQAYTSGFNRVQHYIQAGDCYQVNYAQRFSASFIGSTLAAYQALTQQNQAPFSAYMNFKEHQILCLSPERFIEVRQRKVVTQPIKGTRPRDPDPVKDLELAKELITSSKDQAENLMIVDLLRNDLSKTASNGSVKVTELFGHYRFESVHHLISTIEAELSAEYDNFELLASTLPGGSITGAPKIRAMEIIEELEPTRRNLYCGIIGYLSFNGNMDTNICIRTLIAKSGKIHCWAGGGLVADSEVEKEYQETFDKVAKILPLLESMK